MIQDHRLQRQRFELKYLVDEAITPQIRDFVSSYLELDEYGAGRPNLSYPVHSVYIDSDALATFHSSVNGSKNRFKLRLRYYDDYTDTPVFFEIKGRMDNCIMKERCGVRREAVPMLLAGHLPEVTQLLSKETRHIAAIERFSLLQQQLRGRPKIHNCYLREAWVSRYDNSVRVTFDRHVRIEPWFAPKAATQLTRAVQVFPEFVILELKFTTRFPNWFQDLAQTFNLMRSSASKYAEGILALGESRFHDGDRTLGWEEEALPAPKAFRGLVANHAYE